MKVMVMLMVVGVMVCGCALGKKPEVKAEKVVEDVLSQEAMFRAGVSWGSQELLKRIKGGKKDIVIGEVADQALKDFHAARAGKSK